MKCGYIENEEHMKEFERKRDELLGKPMPNNDTPSKCPTCKSPDPKLHPALQFEGEVHLCDDPFHSPVGDASSDAAWLDDLERELNSADQVVARKWGDEGRSIEGDLERLIALARKGLANKCDGRKS